jgi:thioesterase domain-containing protein
MGSDVRAVRDLVLATTAAVLGHTELDPESSFAELGLTSLTALDLGQRLAMATGAPVPPSIVLGEPTPLTLAKRLSGDGAGGNDGNDGNDGGDADDAQADGSLKAMFARACREGRVQAGVDLLAASADLRSEPGELTPEVTHFTVEGPGLTLVALPSFVAPATAYQFARLASELAGHRFTVVRPSGFKAGQPMAGSTAALVASVAEVVAAETADRPFVLLGYSSGGWLAHAVAREVRPVGLVLLDSYAPRDARFAELESALFRDLLDRNDLVKLVRAADLTAMGRHLRLFDDWTPEAAEIQTLLVRATYQNTEQNRPLPADGRATWPGAHIAEVPGSHVSLLDQHCRPTAAAIRAWLADLNHVTPNRSTPKHPTPNHPTPNHPTWRTP